MTIGGAVARVPKILGADIELGNWIEGLDTATGTGHVASRRLLREIDGVPADGALPVVAWSPRVASGLSFRPGYSTRDDDRDGRCAPTDDPQDWGRRFLSSSGSSVYIDLDHLELAQCETASAFDFVAYSRAMLAIVQGALDRANRQVADGFRVVAMANCSDGLGHSHGAHLNVLMSRSGWDDVCVRKPHYLAYS